MRTGRRLLLLGAVVVGLLTVGVPAEAGGFSPFEAGVAKKPGGPYVDVLQREIPEGQAKDFYVRVVNTTGERQDAELFALLNIHPRYREKYFKGNRNITAEVSDEGFQFSLAPLSAKAFRFRVKVIEDPGPLSPRCFASRFDPVPPMVPDDEASVVVQINGVCA